MLQHEIPKAYEPQKTHDAAYQQWEASGFFNPDNLPGRRPKSFTIAMPPPNATGILHIGHAIMLAIQDVVIRFQRMQGKKALWLPGTDHAAIATQTKVERLLIEQEHLTRHDLGREQFLQRVDQFVAQSQDTIRRQIRTMGSSCDWSRERFTLDQGLNEAVNHAFVQMYNGGLIYRGLRVVNWCPQCHSTLSDDEVEYKPATEKLYWIKYGPFVLATARPETKLGDTAVAVHPDDERYKKYVGTKQIIPGVLGEFEVTVVADRAVDPSFGSGVIKVTPAHDFADFDIAQRHNIPLKQVINEDGRMMDNCGPYAGLTTRECREKIVADMTKLGLIEKIEDYDHNLSVCYRCGTTIEPIPSKQWFINVNQPIKKFGGATIKERALAAVRNGEISIIPDRFEKVYFHWLENLRDWCVSRQIWYGHRIPVWYKRDLKSQTRLPARQVSNPPAGEAGLKSEDAETLYVGVTPPKGEGWEQDPDTLDTWFSSGLWTFSTLGWPASAFALAGKSAGKPRKTGDLKTFHPTDLMETGYDILFFWVARMIIMTTYIMEEVPFKTVYLHGLVRDEQGRKMSKSLGNVIDPLDVVEKFGADATRLSLLIGTTPGNDLNLSEEKIAGYRNFVNKLWNIARYVLITVEKPRLIEKPPKPKTLADRWILGELNTLIEFATDNLERYNLSIVGEKIYEFTWAKFADWYIEIAKIEKDKDEMLLYVLQTLLKLWHPFTPFVTENLWERLNTNSLLLIQPWPASAKASAGKPDATKDLSDFSLIQNIITEIRALRAASGIAPAKKIPALFGAGSSTTLLESEKNIIAELARLSEVTVQGTAQPASAKASAGKPQSLSAVVGGVDIYLSVTDAIDVDQERGRLQKQIDELSAFVTRLEEKLGNEQFVKNAPKAVVVAEQQKLKQAGEQIEKIKQQIERLG